MQSILRRKATKIAAVATRIVFYYYVLIANFHAFLTMFDVGKPNSFLRGSNVLGLLCSHKIKRIQ